MENAVPNGQAGKSEDHKDYDSCCSRADLGLGVNVNHPITPPQAATRAKVTIALSGLLVKHQVAKEDSPLDSREDDAFDEIALGEEEEDYAGDDEQKSRPPHKQRLAEVGRFSCLARHSFSDGGPPALAVAPAARHRLSPGRLACPMFGVRRLPSACPKLDRRACTGQSRGELAEGSVLSLCKGPIGPIQGLEPTADCTPQSPSLSSLMRADRMVLSRYDTYSLRKAFTLRFVSLRRKASN